MKRWLGGEDFYENLCKDEKKIVCENMIAIKRAGADIIITYHALDVAKWIDEFYK